MQQPFVLRCAYVTLKSVLKHHVSHFECFSLLLSILHVLQVSLQQPNFGRRMYANIHWVT